jgi:tRNA threonylcarbamoyladenosine biosynthesis protein TsaE
MKTNDTQAVETHGAEETFAVAEDLGRQLAAGLVDDSPVLVILLSGELGAGKTVYAKGLASGLGVEDADDVVSPTFTLVNEHPLPGGRTFYHIDLYRIGHPDECEGLGLREVLSGNDGSVAAVEWAEKVDGSAWDFTRHPFWCRVSIEDRGADRRVITVEAGESLEFTPDP